MLAAPANRASVATFDPPLVTVEASAVQHYRRDTIRSLKKTGEARIPLNSGIRTRFVAFCDALGENSVAIIVGEPDLAKPVRVRLHSACLTGDVFGSRRCDCGDQLKLSLARLGETGGGIILYLAQEGRGLGLGNKLRTYELQEAGLDTVDANTTLGFDDDERDYGVAARMLEMLGCQRIVLLTNNPTKLDGLAKSGIEIVSRMAVEAPINADSAHTSRQSHPRWTSAWPSDWLTGRSLKCRRTRRRTRALNIGVGGRLSRRAHAHDQRLRSRAWSVIPIVRSASSLHLKSLNG